MNYSIKGYKGIVLTIGTEIIRLGTLGNKEPIDGELNILPKYLFDYFEGTYSKNSSGSVCDCDDNTRLVITDPYPLCIVRRPHMKDKSDGETMYSVDFKSHYDTFWETIEGMRDAIIIDDFILSPLYTFGEVHTFGVIMEDVIKVIESKFRGTVMCQKYGDNYQFVCNGFVLDIIGSTGLINFRKDVYGIDTSIKYISTDMNHVIKVLYDL